MPSQVQLVEHPGQLPVFLADSAPLVGEAQPLPGGAQHPGQLRVGQPDGGFLFHQPEGLAHEGEQLPCGEVGLLRLPHPAALLRQAAQVGGDIRDHPVIVLPLKGQGGLRRVPPGGGVGYGQVVHPLHPLLPADLQQAGEDIQPVRAHGVPVQGDVIAHLVGDQHPAIAV